jgi:SSS family transporter
MRFYVNIVGLPALARFLMLYRFVSPQQFLSALFALVLTVSCLSSSLAAAEPVDFEIAGTEIVESEASVAKLINQRELGAWRTGAVVQRIGERVVLLGGTDQAVDTSQSLGDFPGSTDYSLVFGPSKERVDLPSNAPRLAFGSLSLFSYRPEELHEVEYRGLLGFLAKSRNSFLGLFKSREAAAFTNQMIYIGGIQDGEPSNKVYSLNFDETITEVVELPDLPVPLVGAGSTIIGDVLYVTGGLSSLDPPVHNTKVFQINLKQAKVDLARDISLSMPDWEVLTELPEELQGGVIRPILTAQLDDRVDWNALLVVGGWQPAAGGGGYLPSTEAFYIFPQDGIEGKPKRWRSLKSVPESIRLNSGMHYGQSFIAYGASSAPEKPLSALELWLPAEGEASLVLQDFRTDNWIGLPTTDLESSPMVIHSGRLSVELYSPSSGLATELEFEPAERRFPPEAYLIIVLYIGGMLFLGWFYNRRNKGKGLDQYLLAGRKLHWFIAGISIYASGISAYSFAGIPGKSYAANWLRIGEPIVAFFGMMVVGYFLIPMFRKLGLTTMSQYTEKRFSKLIRTISVANYVLMTLAARMAGILLLPSMALTAVTGVDIYICILFVGVLSTLYTVSGGLNAVVWTDFAQVVILFGGAFLAIGALISGIDGGIGTIFEVSDEYEKMKAFDWTLSIESMTVWVFLLWGISDAMGRMGQDTMQRVFATDGAKSARRSFITCALISVPGAVVFFSIGTFVFVYYQGNPQMIDPTLGAESMFPLFMSQSLPPMVAGLVIAGLFAAAMSTLDTGMQSISTTLVTDWFEAFNKNSNENTRLRTAKIVTVVIGALGTCAAMYVASFEVRSVWDYFGKTLGILGGILSGGFILSIFTTRAHSLGYLAGGIINYIIMFGWTMHNVHWVIYGIVNTVIASILGYVLSLILPKLPSERNKDLTGLTIWTRTPDDF